MRKTPQQLAEQVAFLLRTENPLYDTHASIEAADERARDNLARQVRLVGPDCSRVYSIASATRPTGTVARGVCAT